MQDNINDGVQCAVRSCKYNDNGYICVLKRILVTSDINDKHYCKSFEEKSNMQEF